MSIVPAPVARQPWGMLFPLFTLIVFGALVLYSAAGGSWEPYAASHLVRFGVFLVMAIVMTLFSANLVKFAAYPVYVLILLIGLFPPAGSVISLRKNIIQAFKLPTESMAPTAISGDRILVDKLTPGSWQPNRFDVVVFRCPTDRGKHFIKRVIGLPGDRVAVTDGEVFLNGQALTIEIDGEAVGRINESRNHYSVRVDEPMPEPLAFVILISFVSARGDQGL